MILLSLSVKEKSAKRDQTVLIAVTVAFSAAALLFLIIYGIFFFCKRRKKSEYLLVMNPNFILYSKPDDLSCLSNSGPNLVSAHLFLLFYRIKLPRGGQKVRNELQCVFWI